MAKRRRRRRSTSKRRRRNPAISKKTKKMLLVGGLIGIGYYFFKKQQAPQMTDQERIDQSMLLGLGNYVTPSSVQGMGFDVSRGADAFGDVARADNAYDDTF